MKKFLILFMCFVIAGLSVEAKNIKGGLSNVISHSNIDKSSISISITDLDTGKEVYELNEKNLLHPASVQKVLTLVPAVEVLGNDYKFETSILSRGNDAYVIKLGADPFLTTSELSALARNIDEEKVKTIYIDDSIIESKDWGEGWQWDDDLNTSMPRFNSYNLDGNLMKITVMPSGNGVSSLIINQSKYPIAILNNVASGEINKIQVSRDTHSGSLILEGTVVNPQIIIIPIDNLKRYFNFKLTSVLEDEKIYLKNPYVITKTKDSDKQLCVITHDLSYALDDILKNSSNKTSETVVKLASQKQYNQTGTDALGIKLFDEYCQKIGIDNSKIRIVDASGVSKNNLVNTQFVAEYLYKNKNNPVFEHMAEPGTGTLVNRMIPLKGNLKAKTGTLSDISSIAGFLTTKKNRKYAFCIIINDPSSSSSDKKMLENYLIREMYMTL